jgi:hypothetical protein
MTTTEDRARAAMRAIAGTVNDAPPLRLEAAKDLTPALEEARLGSRRRDAPRPGGASRPGGAPRPGGRGGERRRRWSLLAPIAAAVTIVAVAVTLVVGNTFTGQAIATVGAPAGVFLRGGLRYGRRRQDVRRDRKGPARRRRRNRVVPAAHRARQRPTSPDTGPTLPDLAGPHALLGPIVSPTRDELVPRAARKLS